MENKIYYRWKNIKTKKWKHIIFASILCSVVDLKRSIVSDTPKLSGSVRPFDLNLTDLKTGQSYRDGDHINPNTFLTVRRVPAVRLTAISLLLNKVPLQKKRYDYRESNALNDISMSQYNYGAENKHDDQKDTKTGLVDKKPNKGYVCHICNIPGHFIQLCPNKNTSRVKLREIKDAPNRAPNGMKMRFVVSMDGFDSLDYPSKLLALDKSYKSAPNGLYRLRDGRVVTYDPDDRVFTNMMHSKLL